MLDNQSLTLLLDMLKATVDQPEISMGSLNEEPQMSYIEPI